MAAGLSETHPDNEVSVMEAKDQAHYMASKICGARTYLLAGFPLLHPILERLRLREIVNRNCRCRAKVELGRIAVLVTCNRLLGPRPLYEVKEWAGNTILPQFLGIPVERLYDNRLGRAFDRIHPVLSQVWQELAAKAVLEYGLDLSRLHFDITSFYFEGEYEDSELVCYGYSRDNRPECKQVNLGLNVTGEERAPLLYQIFPGNTADITTPVGNLRTVAAFLARPELAPRLSECKPLLVSDSKMVTKEAVFASHDAGLFYLGPLREGNQCRELISSVSDEELKLNPLSYRPRRALRGKRAEEFVPYRGVLREVVFEEDGRQVRDRALVVWSEKKEGLDRDKRKGELKKLLDGLEKIKKNVNQGRYKRREYVLERIGAVLRGNGAKELVKTELGGEDGELVFNFRIHREKLEEVKRLDGKYVLVTNARHLSADQMLFYYKGQDGVEKRIGVVKGPLRVRPVFLEKRERVEVLVFLNMVALLVYAILETLCGRQGISVSAAKALQRFEALGVSETIFNDGSALRIADRGNEFQGKVLEVLGFPSLERYVADKE